MIGGAVWGNHVNVSFHLDYSTFPGVLLTSFFSLLSGASVGPRARSQPL